MAKAKANKPIEKGSKAPIIKLKDHLSREFDLAGCRGKKVLLSFHPLAWTRVCAMQMKSLEANQPKFEWLGTVAVGVSVDSVPSKAAWAKELGIGRTRLLCDFWPHGRAAEILGIFRRQSGVSERANIIVDAKGKVRWIKVYPVAELPDIEEAIAALSSSA